MEEIWKTIIWKDIETDYVISNLGNVRSLKWGKIRTLKPFYDKLGYAHVDIGGNGKSYPLIHRLVGIHFIPNPDNLPEINHKVGDKKNNRVDNLEWSTRKNNMQHAVKTGLIKFKNRNEHHLSKRVGRFKNGILIQSYDCTAQAGIEGFSQSEVSMCANGKRESHKKFQWSFL